MVADPLFTELLALSGIPHLIEAEKRAEEENLQRQLRHLQMVYEMERRVDETAKSLADRFYPQLLAGSSPDLATIDGELEGRLRMAFPEMDEDILQKVIADGRSRTHNYIRNAFVEKGAEFYSQLGGIPDDLKPKLRSSYVQLRMSEMPPQTATDLLGLQVQFGDEFDRLILPSVMERSRVANLERWLNDEKIRATYSEATVNTFASFRQTGDNLMPQLGMWVMSLPQQEKDNLFGNNPYDPQRRSRRRSAILNRPDLSQLLPPLRVGFTALKDTLRSEIISRHQLRGQQTDPAVVEAELQKRLQEMGLMDEVDYLDYLLLTAYRQQRAYEQTLQQMQRQQVATGGGGVPPLPRISLGGVGLGGFGRGGGGGGGGGVGVNQDAGYDDNAIVSGLGQMVSNTLQPVRQTNLFGRRFTTINSLGFTRMSPPFGQQVQGINYSASPNDLMQDAFANTAKKVERAIDKKQKGYYSNDISFLNDLVPNFEDMFRFFTVIYNQALMQGYSKRLGNQQRLAKWALEVAFGLVKDIFLDVIADNILQQYPAFKAVSMGGGIDFKQSYKNKAMTFFLSHLQMRRILPEGRKLRELANAHPNEVANLAFGTMVGMGAKEEEKRKKEEEERRKREAKRRQQGGGQTPQRPQPQGQPPQQNRRGAGS